MATVARDPRSNPSRKTNPSENQEGWPQWMGHPSPNQLVLTPSCANSRNSRPREKTETINTQLEHQRNISESHLKSRYIYSYTYIYIYLFIITPTSCLYLFLQTSNPLIMLHFSNLVGFHMESSHLHLPQWPEEMQLLQGLVSQLHQSTKESMNSR